MHGAAYETAPRRHSEDPCPPVGSHPGSRAPYDGTHTCMLPCSDTSPVAVLTEPVGLEGALCPGLGKEAAREARISAVEEANHVESKRNWPVTRSRVYNILQAPANARPLSAHLPPKARLSGRLLGGK